MATVRSRGALLSVALVVVLNAGVAPVAAGAAVAAGPDGNGVGTGETPETLYVGDGEDAYRTIGDAVEAASPGDRIVVREGTYEESVVVEKSLTFEARGAVTLRGSPGRPPAFLVQNASGVAVRGFRIVSFVRGVRVENASDVVVADNRFEGVERAVAFQDAATLTVRGNAFVESGSAAVAGGDARGLTVADNRIDDVSGDALFVAGGSDVRVRNNTVVDAREEAVDVSDVAGLTLRENEFRGYGVGVKLADVTQVVVTNNRLVEGRLTGVFVEGADDVLVSENRVEGTGANGIALVDARELRVAENVVTGAGFDGILLVEGRSGVVADNRVRNASRDGVDFRNGRSLTVRANVVADSDGDGVEVANVTGADLTENEIVDTAGDGVRIHNGSSEVTVADGRIAGSDEYGVEVDGPPTRVFVYGNVLRNERNLRAPDAEGHDWDPTDDDYTSFSAANDVQGGGPTTDATSTTASTTSTTGEGGVTSTPADDDAGGVGMAGVLTFAVLAVNAALALGMAGTGVRQYLGDRPLSPRFVGAMVALLLVSATVASGVILAPARVVGGNRPWALLGAFLVALLAGFVTYRLATDRSGAAGEPGSGSGSTAPASGSTEGENVGRASVLDEIDDAILVVDGRREVVDFNRACLDEFPGVETGVDVETALGEWVDVEFPGEGENTATTRATLEGAPGRVRHFLVQVSALGGDLESEAAAAAAQARDERIGHVIRLTEITDIEQRREELERKNEQLDQFASTVSHDLRNPMNVADGYAEILRSNIESGDVDAETLENYVDKIDDALDRMNTIIDDSLMLAREGEVVDDTETLRFSTVVEEAWGNVDTRRASLRVDGDGVFQADRDRLLRLLENLFRNAIDHVGPDVTMTVGFREWGFFVADDGPGIPEEHRDGIFDYGYTTSDDGVGIGLAIVRTIGEAHDWRVDLDPEYDGACFVFSGVDVDRVERTASPNGHSGGGSGEGTGHSEGGSGGDTDHSEGGSEEGRSAGDRRGSESGDDAGFDWGVDAGRKD